MNGIYRIWTEEGIFKKWEYFAFRSNNGITEIRWLPDGRVSNFHKWSVVRNIPNGSEIISRSN